MEDTASNNNTALKIAKLLEEHKGIDTVVIDVKHECSWANYFIITTTRSHTHSAGLLKHLEEFFLKEKTTPLNRRKNPSGQGWLLIDCGEYIIHLMEEEQRSFYELEKLWFKSKVLFHSSKSSLSSSSSIS